MPTSSPPIPRRCWPTCAGTSTAATAGPRSRPGTSPAPSGSTSTTNWPVTISPTTEGRHPFPDACRVRRGDGRRSGIGNDTLVVAYDDTGGLTAGRLVVMLRMLGCDAAVLVGGLDAWTGRDRDRPGAAHPTPAEFIADRVAERSARHRRRRRRESWPRAVRQSTPARTSASSARSPRSTSGAGHIPGARSAPWSAVLDADTTPRSPDELRAHYRALGVDDEHEVVAYCGSGVSACMNVLAMEHAGLAAPRLYVASWSGWSADPNREAATGE